MAPFTIIIETIVIYGMIIEYEFWPALGISTVVNLVSGMIGYLVMPPYFGHFPDILNIALTGSPTSYYYIDQMAQKYLYFGIITVTFLLSVLIEGLLLTWYLKSMTDLSRIWLTSTVANLISYIGMLLIWNAFSRMFF
jgi:hypothetical protein